MVSIEMTNIGRRKFLLTAAAGAATAGAATAGLPALARADSKPLKVRIIDSPQLPWSNGFELIDVADAKGLWDGPPFLPPIRATGRKSRKGDVYVADCGDRDRLGQK